jgi:hypothetical protein
MTAWTICGSARATISQTRSAVSERPGKISVAWSFILFVVYLRQLQKAYASSQRSRRSNSKNVLLVPASHQSELSAGAKNPHPLRKSSLLGHVARYRDGDIHDIGDLPWQPLGKAGSPHLTERSRGRNGEDHPHFRCSAVSSTYAGMRRRRIGEAASKPLFCFAERSLELQSGD